MVSDEGPLELEIERLSSDGEGVGRAKSGLTVFVPFTAPGDRVRVRVVDQRRRFARAEMIELLEPGEARVEPLCSYHGRCGGCSWQHLDYSAQVIAKENMIRDALERIAREKHVTRIAFESSPIEYGYRVRTRMLAGAKGLGYRERASHTLCAVDRCPILAPALQSEAERVSSRMRDPTSEMGPVETKEWELVADTEGRARSTPLPIDMDAGGARSSLVSRFEIEGKKLEVSPGSFVQANGAMHGLLYRSVLEQVGEGDRALELHAGAGFFTLGLVDRFKRLDVIESSPSAVADLRFNLAGTKGLHILATQAESSVPEKIEAFPDCVLMDPPRTGLSLPLLEGVAALNPTRIVYLSCDPATWARDLARFADRGYSLQRVQGFDLFPQTPHVEVLATLIRD